MSSVTEQSPDVVHSSQTQRFVLEGLSGVNGKGMWQSFTRSFTSPEVALWDLFDNTIDATLHEDFRGMIDVYGDPTSLEDSLKGICIRNNSAKPIPNMQTVLEVFGSSKGREAIGENGVGIKHACAALSNLSIIISKNGNTIGIGFISENLQTDEVCYPSYSLLADTLDSDLDSLMFTCSYFRDSLEEYGNNDTAEGRDRLENHINGLLDLEDEHAFLVVLTKIRQRLASGVPVMLEKLKTAIPRNYLHIPSHFRITVNGVPCSFRYWERQLVELHHFPLIIDPVHPYQTALDWHMPRIGYRLEVFIGFDPQRAKLENNNKASLLLFSRKSGRLVSEYKDARDKLGLANGGTDFGQGLTILVDDRTGRIPLLPTKQGPAFGESKTGKIHEENLYQWVGAMAHAFYQKFLEDVGGTKKTLGNIVRGLSDRVPIPNMSDTLLNFSNFSTAQGMSFSKKLVKGKIRCVNRKACTWISNPGTGINIIVSSGMNHSDEDDVSDDPKPTKRKRKSENEKKVSVNKKRKVSMSGSSHKRKSVSIVTAVDGDSEVIRTLQHDLVAEKQLSQRLAQKLKQIQERNEALVQKMKVSNTISRNGVLKDDNADEDVSVSEIQTLLEENQRLSEENQNLASKVAAQKKHIRNLQNSIQSLQQLSDL